MILFAVYLLFSVVLGLHWATHRKEYFGRLMIAPLVPLIFAAGSAVYQGIKGARAKKEGRKLQAEADRMEEANVAEAKRMAMSGMPEAEYRRALDNINRSQAASLAALRDRRMALPGATTIQQATNDSLQSLAAQDARMRLQNQNNALNFSGRAAALKGDRAALERASGEALTGAGIQNLFNTAGYASMLYGANDSGGGIFGNSSDGAYNRLVLGSTPISGGSSMQKIGRGLTRPVPTLPYSKPY